METQQNYYTEPYKDKSQWKVDRVQKETNSVLETFAFHTEKIANSFLEQKSFYVGGKLVHKG